MKFYIPLILLTSMSVLSPAAKCDVPTHILISGENGEIKELEIESYNRIRFFDEHMILTSADDADVPEMELLYTLFNHFELGTKTSSIDIKSQWNDCQLLYSASESNLVITGDSEGEFIIGIFNLQGSLLRKGTVSSTDAFNVSTLLPGVYVAVATNNDIKLVLKFVVK